MWWWAQGSTHLEAAKTSLVWALSHLAIQSGRLFLWSPPVLPNLGPVSDHTWEAYECCHRFNTYLLSEWKSEQTPVFIQLPCFFSQLITQLLLKNKWKPFLAIKQKSNENGKHRDLLIRVAKIYPFLISTSAFQPHLLLCPHCHQKSTGRKPEANWEVPEASESHTRPTVHTQLRIWGGTIASIFFTLRLFTASPCQRVICSWDNFCHRAEEFTYLDNSAGRNHKRKCHSIYLSILYCH